MKSILSNIKAWFIVSDQLVKKRRVSLWEQYNTVDEYNKALEARIIERAEKDRLRGDLKKAIERYEGFFQFYSGNQEIHNRVAELYIEINDRRKAGRHLFFKEELSDIEKECIACFVKSCGDSPTIILKKLLSKKNYRLKELKWSTKKKLKNLVEEAVVELGTIPNFLKGIKRHLDKIVFIKSPVTVDYMLRYFGGLMNKQEELAWRHYSSEYKLTHRENQDSIEKIRKIYLSKGWLTEDEQIIKLLENGIDHFRLKTAERILNENLDKINFNNCPKCGKLARTPKAKQCRFCGYDWH